MAILPQHVIPMYLIMSTAIACGIVVIVIGIYGLIKLAHGEMP